MSHHALLAFALLLTCGLTVGTAESTKVDHPYLLWTQERLGQLRQKVKTVPWAQEAYQQMREATDRDGEDLRLLFQFAVMGDQTAGEIQKQRLLKWIESPDPLGAAIEWRILAYDLLFHQLSLHDRTRIENRLRRYIQYAIKPGGTFDTTVFNNERNYANYDGEEGHYTRTNWLPNIIFPWKLSANLAAAVIGDESLIRETWDIEGSIRWYLDEYLGDLGFYEEEFSKMGSTPGAMLLYCTAVRNLGLNELGFGYRGQGGATMRGHLESVLHFTFPAVDVGTNRARFERVSAGDVRPWLPLAHATVEGYFPDGTGGDKLWQAHGAWGGTKRGSHAQWDGYSNFTPKMQLRMWFEWGHQLWPDARFDWFLDKMRAPDDDVYTPTLYFGLDPINPSDVVPPPIQSAVYSDRGFAMLRAVEGPQHWLSPAPAVCLRLTAPYAHSVNDSLVLAGFYAFNRPIYQNPKPDPGYAFKFSRSIRSHCGVMVDGHVKIQDWGQTGSLEPQFTDDCRTRHDFSNEVKFVAAETSKRYPGIDETRVLMLTREYLFDLFSARDHADHSYVWLVHTFGEARPEKPEAWHPSNDLHDLVKELSRVQTFDSQGKSWNVTVRQTPPENPPLESPFGEQWWDRDIGVRIHMLGQENAKAHIAETPKPYGNRDARDNLALVDGVTIVSSVHNPSARFIALHEPFERQPIVERFELVAEAEDAIAVRVVGESDSPVNDRLLVAVGQRAIEPVTLVGDGESYTFTGYAFVRARGDDVVIRGELSRLELPVGDCEPQLRINGMPRKAVIRNRVLYWQAADSNDQSQRRLHSHPDN